MRGRASQVRRHLATLGTSDCDFSSDFRPLSGAERIQEIGLDVADGSFWALVFDPLPLLYAKVTKIVWRMTGSGDFIFRIQDSHGQCTPLVSGPTSHTWSSWTRRGDEVGTAMLFPHPGCWNVLVTKADVSAALWLHVEG
jgi:hypothetical protein